MNGIAELTALNRFILDLVWFVPLVCVGVPLFLWCVYWLCFGRQKHEPNDEPFADELIIHMYVGPCLSERDIAEIESENVTEKEDDAWSL